MADVDSDPAASPGEPEHQVSMASLTKFYTAVLVKQGAYEADAESAAQLLSRADALHRQDAEAPLIGMLLEGISLGEIDPRASVLPVMETPTTVILDAGGGLGSAALERAMKEAIEKTASLGTGIVYVTRCRRVPPARVALRSAIAAGLCGLVVASDVGSPPNTITWCDEKGNLYLRSGAEPFWSRVQTAYEEGVHGHPETLPEQVAILLRATRTAQQFGRIGTKLSSLGRELCIYLTDPDESDSLRKVLDDLPGQDEPLPPLDILTDAESTQHWTCPPAWVPMLEKMAKRARADLPWQS